MGKMLRYPDVEAEVIVNCCLVTKEVLDTFARLLYGVKVVDSVVGAFVGAMCTVVVAMGDTIDSEHR